MANIFISYSRSETTFVDRLSADLLGRGFNVWVDRRRLEGGQDWSKAIQRAINDAVAVIVVLSPDSMQSRYVLQEYRYAQRSGIRIIPVIVGSRPERVGTQRNAERRGAYVS